MFNDVPEPAAPLAVTAETSSPAPELPPPGESVPPPTDAQVQTADHVFTTREKHNPIVTLLGVYTSAMILRDVAVDTFDSSDEEDLEDEDTAPGEKTNAVD
jgi:hypothetical protein